MQSENSWHTKKKKSSQVCHEFLTLNQKMQILHSIYINSLFSVYGKKKIRVTMEALCIKLSRVNLNYNPHAVSLSELIRLSKNYAD